MATQSLYRRYRPRRFSEVRGQDHVVKALRNSVAEGREGQAYLFSGPRGTGKTTSARILAKVLNCTNAIDGEPCCECESCLSVERGTSYDVHELDAASNNGVDAMRDLIDKASLGTPGRHKVYILDEVHMLTKPAEAALLKTLEEPPPHVVFVLATTDPQKMSDTIRSRTQHLQFHLLPADTLQAHVRWVAEDAGLTVSDTAFEQVLAQGGGSARDTLSALELVANTGGEGAETVPVGEFVEAMIEHDPGRALTAAAAAIGLGRDPRTLTEELIAYLRNGFLSIMAPDLVQLPSARVSELSEQAQRLGAAGLVRGIEQLGAALSEMRHAPDPRVLLDVAIVKLTSDAAASGDAGAAVSGLVARVSQLEKQLAEGVPAAAAAGTGTGTASGTPSASGPAGAGAAGRPAADAAEVAAPRDPATGRATLGGRARKAAPAEAAPVEAAPVEAAPAKAAPPAERVDDASPAAETPPSAAPEPVAATPEPAAPSTAATAAMNQSVWDDTVKPSLRGMARAVFSPATYVSNTDTVLTLALPNPVHRDKCEQHRNVVETELTAVAGAPVTLELVLTGDGPGGGAAGGGSGGSDGGSNATGDGAPDRPAPAGDGTSPGRSGPASVPDTPIDPGHPAADPSADASAAAASTTGPPVVADRAVPAGSAAASAGAAETPTAPIQPAESPRRAAERKAAEAAAQGIVLSADDEPVVSQADLQVLPEDHEVDLTELIDAPPESVKTPIDRLAEAFPGSELVNEAY